MNLVVPTIARVSSIMLLVGAWVLSAAGAARANDIAALSAASDGGNLEATRQLAQLYESGGDGVCRDPAKAYQLYQKAMMQGDRGAYADIMRTSAAIDATGTAYVVPDHVRQRTADAITQARMWHADAQLSDVEIMPERLGSIMTVEILSPSTGQGLWVFYERCATAPPMTHDAGTVSWSKAKLDTSFVDFDQAKAVARAHGLAGEIDHARLEQTDRGLFVWRISPKGAGDLIVDAHTAQSYTASQASTMGLGLPHLQGPPAGHGGQITAATAGSPKVDWFTKSFGVMGPQIRANMQHGCTGGSQWKAGGRCE